MPKVILQGYIIVPEGDLEAVNAELPTHISATRSEPGCLFFEVTASSEQPGRFDVYEEFTDATAFEHHQQRVADSQWGRVTQNVSRHYTLNGSGGVSTPEDSLDRVEDRKMDIRLATPEDFSAIWPIFREVVQTGDTYTYDRDISEAQAMHKWMEVPARTYVAEDDGTILGTYYIKQNHEGGGAHVCNCGYMVAGAARGRGLATAMCEHSQQIARDMGFKAMQYNFVVESNTGAVRLWQQLGFDIVATVPGVFKHPQQGYVGAHVMLKWLE